MDFNKIKEKTTAFFLDPQKVFLLALAIVLLLPLMNTLVLTYRLVSRLVVCAIPYLNSLMIIGVGMRMLR